VRVVRGLLRVFGVLPLSILHRFGGVLSGLARLVNSREVRVARRNIALAFPEADSRRQVTMLHATLRETACGLTELPRIWGVPAARALALIVAVRGLEHLQRAQALGCGVLVAAPHLGQWELLNLYLCSRAPMALLYRPPQHAVWEPLLLAARGTLGAQQIRADAAGVRALVRALHQGKLVGILPDQRPKGGEGAFAPFFGRPCKSMTLLGRLAHKTGAPVVFGFAERLPGGAGYCVHVLPAPEGIAAADPETTVTALHAGIEACVRLAPLQYQWTYKRYSMQPDSTAESLYPDCR
jgi:KDO2-lipid IV(A) lauroyltransferase